MRALVLLAVAAKIAAAGPVKLPPLTLDESKTLEAKGSPAIAGVHRALPANVMSKGKWKKAADGRQQWRLEIQSPGAKAMRAHLEAFDTGEGKVRVCEKAGTRCYGPYSGKGPLKDGTFWSDVVEGDTIIIEYTAASRAATLPFKMARIAHQK